MERRPEAGPLTVAFKPLPVNVAELTLSSAPLVIDRILPIGNAPPMGPPPPTHLPIDALSLVGASVDFEHLPQGVYSRVRFAVDSLMIQGTWRGTPFVVRIGMFGGAELDVRSNVGQEIGPQLSATLVVEIDVGSWFSGAVLDAAIPSGGQIVCDQQNNPTVTAQLSLRVNGSFSLP